MDVIEVPSHFMEHFMTDPRTVHQFARHNMSGACVPEGLVQQAVQDSQLFGALDLESQVTADTLALLMPRQCSLVLIYGFF